MNVVKVHRALIKERGTIVKITEEKLEVLRYLAALDLKPGASVKFEKKIPFNGSIVLKVQGANCVLGYNVASIIKVKRF